jgi:hypothetical protein
VGGSILNNCSLAIRKGNMMPAATASLRAMGRPCLHFTVPQQFSRHLEAVDGAGTTNHNFPLKGSLASPFVLCSFRERAVS